MSRWIATLGGIGHLPWAPGTWGSLAALPCAWGLHWLGGFPLVAGATLVMTVIGVWAVEAYGQGDAPQVVVDELVGQWIALWPLSLGLWVMDAAPHLFPYPGWVGGFVLFRLFDIWKPWPVSWIDRQKGAWAVMADDIAAGGLAAAGVTLAAVVAHGGI